MQFIGREAERDFKLHFHRQRVPQDRVFACTQVRLGPGALASSQAVGAAPDRALGAACAFLLPTGGTGGFSDATAGGHPAAAVA